MELLELEESKLEELPIFDGITARDIRSMLGFLGGYMRSYKRNQYILLDEEMVTNVCVLLSGCVHMLKEDEDGHLTLITYMQPGELFGESFALRKLPRTKVSFLASKRSVVLFLPLAKVMNTCDNNCLFHQRMITNMYELLSRKNLALMQKIDIISKDRLRDKILCFLELQLSGKPEYGASRELEIKGNTLQLPLNKTEFAHYLNVNRTSLCRELAAMEQDGIIKVQGDRYTLIGM